MIDCVRMLTEVLGDTHFLPSYFEIVRKLHMEKRQEGCRVNMALYHPLIIFDRNANDVPCLVRVADLMYDEAFIGEDRHMLTFSIGGPEQDLAASTPTHPVKRSQYQRRHTH